MARRRVQQGPGSDARRRAPAAPPWLSVLEGTERGSRYCILANQPSGYASIAHCSRCGIALISSF